jgi:hypothetical protein
MYSFLQTVGLGQGHLREGGAHRRMLHAAVTARPASDRVVSEVLEDLSFLPAAEGAQRLLKHEASAAPPAGCLVPPLGQPAHRVGWGKPAAGASGPGEPASP